MLSTISQALLVWCANYKIGSGRKWVLVRKDVMDLWLQQTRTHTNKCTLTNFPRSLLSSLALEKMLQGQTKDLLCSAHKKI